MFLIWLLLVLRGMACEDYEFETSEDQLNETENGSDMEMTLAQAIKLIKVEEIENLKLVIERKEEEIKQLTTEKQNLIVTCDKEKTDLKSKHNFEKENLVDEMKNRNILVRFLTKQLVNNENQSKTSRDAIKAQNEKLRILGEERTTYQEKNKVNLRQAFLQAEVILSQERQKEDLKGLIKIEKGLMEDYFNLTELSKTNSVDQYPLYVQMMSKAMVDQTAEINQLR